MKEGCRGKFGKEGGDREKGEERMEWQRENNGEIRMGEGKETDQIKETEKRKLDGKNENQKSIIEKKGNSILLLYIKNGKMTAK